MTLNEKNLDLCFGWMFCQLSDKRGVMVYQYKMTDKPNSYYYQKVYFDSFSDGKWHEEVVPYYEETGTYDDWYDNSKYYDSFEELTNDQDNSEFFVGDWVPGNNVNAYGNTVNDWKEFLTFPSK
jgi:hypothetical protein